MYISIPMLMLIIFILSVNIQNKNTEQNNEVKENQNIEETKNSIIKYMILISIPISIIMFWLIKIYIYGFNQETILYSIPIPFVFIALIAVIYEILIKTNR